MTRSWHKMDPTVKLVEAHCLGRRVEISCTKPNNRGAALAYSLLNPIRFTRPWASKSLIVGTHPVPLNQSETITLHNQQGEPGRSEKEGQEN